MRSSGHGPATNPFLDGNKGVAFLHPLCAVHFADYGGVIAKTGINRLASRARERHILAVAFEIVMADDAGPTTRRQRRCPSARDGKDTMSEVQVVDDVLCGLLTTLR